MASNCDRTDLRSDSAASNSSEGYGTPEEGRSEEGSFKIHKAAFHGSLARVTELLRNGCNPSAQDKHGNTPLHIAVMLGHKSIIQELLKHGSVVKEKNTLGWTPLDEAVSYGDKSTITSLLKKLQDQTTEGIMGRRQELIKSLQNLDDFYAELKWEFHSWVPLLSRLLPSDVCRIYKSGNCIRLDSTLGDFTEMKWTQGDLSFIFNGDDSRGSKMLSLTVLDNRSRQYQRIRLLGGQDVDTDVNEHVELLMTRPIVYANMSTQPITVTRAQSGWFFRVDKTERVGEYDTDVFNITNLILLARKRREHLTPEQIRQQEELAKKVERGDIQENDIDEETKESEIQSLPPPPPISVTWDQYIGAPEGEPPHIGRPMDMKIERKYYRAAACMAEACPIELKQLLDILEVITPYKHFHKLRQFCSLRLPPGFPVKLDIPVYPTVTATITLQKYVPKTHPTSVFLVPRDYKKVGLIP